LIHTLSGVAFAGSVRRDLALCQHELGPTVVAVLGREDRDHAVSMLAVVPGEEHRHDVKPCPCPTNCFGKPGWYLAILNFASLNSLSSEIWAAASCAPGIILPMVSASDLEPDLLRLEQLAAEGEKRDICARLGTPLELLLKHRVSQILEAGNPNEFEALKGAMKGPLGQQTLGNLIGLVRKDALLKRGGLANRLWAARDCRNWGAHNMSGPEPHFADVLGSLDTVWQLGERLEVLNPGLRQELRERVVGRGGRPATQLPTGVPPVYYLDRHDQRQMFDSVFPPTEGVLVVAMYGERGQGQSALADYCFTMARSRQPGSWVDFGDLGWPAPGLPSEFRRRELAESLTQVLQAEQHRLDTDDPSEALRFAMDAGPVRPWVRHTIRRPTREDADLLNWYLAAVWAPAAQQASRSAGLLSIECAHAEPRGPLWSKQRRQARRERAACDLITERLGSQDVDGLDLLALGQLCSVSRRDIAIFLATYLGREQSADALDGLAEEIFLSAGLGRFDEVWRDCSNITAT
jgi:hypothetical protein